ncbi:hypothetical protein BDA99DRAFT_327035 [Phascolomyces articulosus]|uniref:Uncharacterized protein n=1 Tax=Phascolomyces articulosus TaxID=60185 RepID=A0AAD5K5V8_9FUNG|nr:hypothetical protein BDA99DRAFT_327035 [Phascolomyces articulosus]
MDHLRPEGSSGNRRESNTSSRPPFVQSRSCPNIPELLIESDVVHPCQPNERDDRQHNQNSDTTTSSESDTVDDDDDEKKVAWTSAVPSPTRHNRISSLSSKERKPPSSTGGADELLEAALDHKEAQDRHVRFQDHVMESAALVERMLSIRDGNNPQDMERLTRRLRSNSVMDEADLEGGENAVSSPGAMMMMPEITQHDTVDSGGTGSGAMGGNVGLGAGSVLSSLMKLEAQRRRKEQEQEFKKQKRKERKVK